MELIGYKNSSAQTSNYKGLVSKLYSDYPNYKNYLCKTTEKAFVSNNPFFEFGTIKNFLLLDEKETVAHMSAILDERLPDKVAYFGFFETKRKRKYVKFLLEKIRSYFKSKNKSTILGPIDLSPWIKSRVSFPEEGSPYASEPFTKGYYRKFLLDSGLEAAQKNYTIIKNMERLNKSEYRNAFQKLTSKGYSFELFQNNKKCLRSIYKIVKKAFNDTWLYSSISFKELNYIVKTGFKKGDSPFTYIIKTDEGEPVGFLYGLFDNLNPSRKRLVVKIMGVVPDYQGRGIGKALLHKVYKEAKKEKLRKVIFSTMRKDNESIQSLVGKGGNLYRKYEIYKLEI